MSSRSFKDELKLDEERRLREETMPAQRHALRRRLEATLHGRREVRHRTRVWVPVALTLACVTVIYLKHGTSSRQLATFQLTAASSDLSARVDASGAVQVEKGSCTLFDAPSGVAMSNAGPVALRREAKGLRLLAGRAEFKVQHRARSGPPATILVLGGEIEVMGTRFGVSQGEQSVEITLHEGSIRFRPTEGSALSLQPGQTLRWPPAPVPRVPSATTPEPPLEAHPAPHTAEFSPEDVLERVGELRSRREFEEAVRELTHALKSGPSVATAERLSFELGALLSYQIRDPARACPHWAAHLQRFHAGRYGPEVRRAQENAGCRGRRHRSGGEGTP